MKLLLDRTQKVEFCVATFLSVAMISLIVLVKTQTDPAIQAPSNFVSLEPITVFPDFASIQNIEIKKQQFFDYLQDYIVAENLKIHKTRSQLISYAQIAYDGVVYSSREKDWLMSLSYEYRIDSDFLNERDLVNELLLRVDVIPASLVLAQAANESAWGTSRFTLEGNNIFGQWCYEAGCGIVPNRRPSGATHEVKKFYSVEESVTAYFTNINSHHLYQYFRKLRAQMRAYELDLDPMVLTYGLGRYSERGDSYVDEVQSIIIQNELQDRDNAHLNEV
jgi:Bax protein